MELSGGYYTVTDESKDILEEHSLFDKDGNAILENTRLTKCLDKADELYAEDQEKENERKIAKLATKSKLYRWGRTFLKILLWMVYIMFTQKDRQKYYAAQKKGMACVNTTTRLSSITFEFDPSKKPQERDYLNWKEFRKVHRF